MGPARYRNVQVGYLALLVLGGGTALGVWRWAAEGPSRELAIALAVLGFLLVLFSHQTVEVGARELRSSFGLGLFGVSIPLTRIRDVRVVPNSPWWHGAGIRLTPSGPLYNVSGSWAVEVEDVDGRTLRIGTNEPASLHAALREACPRLD